MNEVPVEVVHLALYGLYGLAWEHQVNHHFSTPKKKVPFLGETVRNRNPSGDAVDFIGTWKVNIEIQQRKSGLMEFTLQLVSWHSDIFLCDLLQTRRSIMSFFLVASQINLRSHNTPRNLRRLFGIILKHLKHFESMLSQQSKEGFGSLLCCMWTHVDDPSRKNVGILDCKPPTNKNQ